jgi:hypothetical protein
MNIDQQIQDLKIRIEQDEIKKNLHKKHKKIISTTTDNLTKITLDRLNGRLGEC